MEAGKWGKSALLFPFPNRLRDGQYSWFGHQYAFPINSAATHNAIHGFIRDEAFEVVRVELTTENAEITCRFDYRGIIRGTRSRLCSTSRSASPTGTSSTPRFLQTATTVPTTAGLGWHPYFRLTGKADHHHGPPACALVEYR